MYTFVPNIHLMEKSVPITIKERHFFRQYLEIMNPIVLLKNRELDVLAELLHHNHELKDIPEEHRWKLILGYDTKVKIQKHLELSEASLNNILSSLRKKGIIKDKAVLKNFWANPDEEFDLTFKFRPATNGSP